MTGGPWSRRSFLRGAAGVAVSLPFLPSLLPRGARAEVAGPPRYLALFAPCGAWMDSWTPASTGAGYRLSPTLAPLAAYRSRTTVVSGLVATATESTLMGFHHREAGSWLTATPIQPTFDAGAMVNGWSTDQLLADAFGAGSALPSVQLGPRLIATPHDPLKPYAEAYECAVSWRGNLPLLGLISPSQVWLRLVGDGASALTGPLLEAERARKRSVLDIVRDDLASVRGRAGVEDQTRLDEYLTALRAIEQDLDRGTVAPSCAIDPPGDGPPFGYADGVETMLSLLVRLVQCDVSRYATVLLNTASESRVWTSLGHTTTHHDLTHHLDDPWKIEQVQRIDLEQARILARFLDQLDALPDASGGTLLSNSVVLYGSGMGDGNLHFWEDLPMLYVGDAGGRLVTGTHVAATGRPLADLHLTMLRALGLDLDAFADSEGTIDALIG